MPSDKSEQAIALIVEAYKLLECTPEDFAQLLETMAADFKADDLGAPEKPN